MCRKENIVSLEINSEKYFEQIYLTQPSLPSMQEFLLYLTKIWENKWITNNGPFHHQLEIELSNYLGTKYVSLFSNGTSALIAAIKALDLKGEVITTPFSFVATTNCLSFNNIIPVFVDIEPEFLNIDPDKIEESITQQTSAILPVHTFGNPCEFEKIQKIADSHGLKVLYDAASTFGITKNGFSLSLYGDLSILSFHATKVFNTIEGGAIVSHDKKTKTWLDSFKNFGFSEDVFNLVNIGINAKMNEIQAALGLLNLKYIKKMIQKRAEIARIYRRNLSGITGIRVFNEISGIAQNYTYFPILIDKNHYGTTRDYIYFELKKRGIHARRYFYPLISQLSLYNHLPSASKNNLPIAEKISEQILCLPIYPELKLDNVSRIISFIQKNRKE
jgi:dTDP-4-amino-4,6-dideoxygalactose transaminase